MQIIKDIFRYLTISWFKNKYKNTKIISGYFNSTIKGIYSQDGQDSFIYSEFYSYINKQKFPKIFIDIGCSHPVKFSNSLFFEEALGFRVIGVDPLPIYIDEWKKLRPTATMYCLALGNENSEMKLSVPADNVENSSMSHSADMFSTLNENNNRLNKGVWNKLRVPVKKTQDFVDELLIPEIGVLSIDVEGFELNVLKGLDFKKTTIYFAIIENNSTNRFGSDDIRNLMNENGFNFYARFWGLDDIYVNKKLINCNEF